MELIISFKRAEISGSQFRYRFWAWDQMSRIHVSSLFQLPAHCSHLSEWTTECPAMSGHSDVFSPWQDALLRLCQPRTQIVNGSNGCLNHLWAYKEANITGVWFLFPFCDHIDIILQGLQINFILRLFVWIFSWTLIVKANAA